MADSPARRAYQGGGCNKGRPYTWVGSCIQSKKEHELIDEGRLMIYSHVCLM